MQIPSSININPYYKNCVWASLKQGALKACPLTSFFISIFKAVITSSPSCLFADPDFDDPEEHFLMNDSLDSEEFISFFAHHFIEIDENYSSNAQKKLMEQTKAIYRASLAENSQIVDALNADFNITAKLCYSAKMDGEITNCASAYGCSKSFTDPLIGIEIPAVHIPYIQALENGARLHVPSYISLQAKQFLLAHEYMHILNNDMMFSAVWDGVTSLISCLPWVVDYHSSMSWTSYLISSTTKSFLIETTSALCHQMFARNFEKRADIEAIDYLKTNKGAEEFFSAENKIDDPLHPPIKERREYIKNWSAA